MRKLLLAGAAVIGGVAGGPVMAQTAGPVLPPTWTEAPVPTAPSGIASANTNLSGQGYYTKGPLPAPTPGSIVVRFNGRVVFYGYAANQSSDTITTFDAAGKPLTSRKAAPYGTLGYLRMYQGVDGMTASGLRYGAAAEIRVTTSPTTGASVTSGGASGAASGSGPSTVGSTLYVRRAFVYLGGNWGALHFGQDDGPLGLMDGGVTTFQTYNDGGWNDDLPVSPDAPVFPFPSGIGNEYTTSKVVYLSPQLAGFDFATSFEPDDNVLNDTIGAGGANSPQLSTGATASEIARRRNTYEAAIRYQGNVGPAGLYAMAGYMGSGHVTRGIGAPTTNYDNLGLVMAGAAVNFGGLRVGGSFVGGQGNNQLSLKADGQANMVAWLAGVQYTAGPMTIGASYMNILSGGALGAPSAGNPSGVLGSQRREGGLNVGGTYVLAPGLLGWLSADYGQRYQGGWNFSTSTVGADRNNVKFTAIALGGMVRW